MNIHYTIISYIEGQEGWHDRCGDYYPGAPSECSIKHYEALDDAAKDLATLRFNANAQVTLLCNGIDLDDPICKIGQEELKILQDNQMQLEDLCMKYYQNLKEDRERSVAEQKRLAFLEQERQKRILQKEKEARDLALLAQLKSQYER